MKRVLVAALGMSPAVVTETLWKLHADGEAMPDAIVVVTTGTGRGAARQALCDGPEGMGAVSRFCLDHGLEPIPVRFEVPVDEAGTPFDDINDTTAATAMADLFVRVVRDLTNNPSVAVHASIAGGRKTMSCQLGYAMTLFGRECDRLTHVLIRPTAFEHVPTFFYPPSRPMMLPDRSGVLRDTGEVAIDLAEIPFLSVRGFLDDDTLSGKRPLEHEAIRETLAAARRNAGGNAPGLLFRADGRTVTVCGVDIVPQPRAYALFRLYAEAAKERWPGASADGFGPNHCGWIATNRFDDPEDPVVTRYVDLWEGHPDTEYGIIERTRQKLAAHKEPNSGKLNTVSQTLDIAAVRSRLCTDMEEAIKDRRHTVPPESRAFLLHNRKSRNRYRAGLLAAPDRIVFE